jgi:predicted small lipoprotein YifL
MRILMKTPWLPIILTVLLSLGLAACGKKGPPIPPDDEPKKESPASPKDSGDGY